MSTAYPRNNSFGMDDDELLQTNTYRNSFLNDDLDNGENFEHSNSTLHHSGVALDKTRSSLYQTGQQPEKSRLSLNPDGSFPEKTRSTLLPTSNNNSEVNIQTNNATEPHEHRHRHQHHHHKHAHHHHDHEHHHHQHTHEHVHEQEPHEHIHHHHHHEPEPHEHVHHVHDHDHHHHGHDHQHHHEHTTSLPPIHNHQLSDTPSALTIRRHTPGVTDPTLYNFPVSYSPERIYSTPVHNVSLPPNVHVTVRRNIPQAEHTLIQPILYPVAIYHNSSAPQQRKESPKPRTPKRTRPEPKPPTPKPPTPKPRTPMRTSPIPPVSPARRTPPPPPPPPPKPRPPVKSPVKSPIKPAPKPRPLPVSPVQPEPEPSPVPPPPPPKAKNVLFRKPIRTDDVQSTVQRISKTQIISPRRTTRVVVQEPPGYSQSYRRSSVYPTARRTVSYRTVPGMTTREMENEEMDDTGAPIYVQTPRVQTVTFRT
ncbi:unnamed protein product [Adineta ricciae]|uniref:Uncharacterized protein n=1 Tax=Adineta ricciae TaxID=249248 RepID=A0A813MGH7_ADIRI|nr:unnamed protein product [Adineta ricciae]CAF0819001.1 unnamed protein product [Adineta ricciae]